MTRKATQMASQANRKPHERLAAFLQNSYSFYNSYYPYLQPKDNLKYILRHNTTHVKRAG